MKSITLQSSNYNSEHNFTFSPVNFYVSILNYSFQISRNGLKSSGFNRSREVSGPLTTPNHLSTDSTGFYCVDMHVCNLGHIQCSS